MSKTAFVLAGKGLEIINRMPEYDAVFITPDAGYFTRTACGPRIRARPEKPAKPEAETPRARSVPTSLFG